MDLNKIKKYFSLLNSTSTLLWLVIVVFLFNLNVNAFWADAQSALTVVGQGTVNYVAKWSSAILAPAVPTISGANSGYIDVYYTYTFTSLDPGGSQVRYGIDWSMPSDGVADEWLPAGVSYVDSGVSQSASHGWSTEGTKTFKALAQNTQGVNSSWSSNYSVSISSSPITGVCGPAARTYNGGTEEIPIGGEDGGGGYDCPTDLKQCLDGSFVSRVGPLCEFNLCPEEIIPTETSYSEPFCTAGTPSPEFPFFPSAGSPSSWVCFGSGGGEDSPTCTASLVAGSYTVTVSDVTGGGSVVSSPLGINCSGDGINCSYSYGEGEAVTLTAVPNSSYWVFTGWGGTACSGISPECSFSVDAAKSVTATFNLRAFNYKEF